MQIEINGSSHTIKDNSTIEQCLIELDKLEKGIALAIEQSIVPRSTWSKHQLNNGDIISIFRAIAGG